jgi:hypothetical protein
MKTKMVAVIIIGLTLISAQAWDGGCRGGYYSGGYNPAPCYQSAAMGRYYGGGGCGGWNGGGAGLWGTSSSFGNQYGQWGNGQGATLNGVANIIAAFAPILAQPQQQVIVRQPY